jgi:hypothetical protein
VLGTVTTTAPGIIQVSGLFTSSGTKTIKEIGLFDGTSGSTMISRKTISGVPVEPSDTITINYKISII